MNNNQKVLISIISGALAILIAVGIIIWKWPSIKSTFTKDEKESKTTTSQSADNNKDDTKDDNGGTSSENDAKIENIDTGKKSIEVTDVVASTSSKEIVVPIYANENPGIAAALLFINYDTEAFSFSDCQGGDIFDNCAWNFDEKDNTLKIVAQCGSEDSTELKSVSGAGILTKIILKPTAKAKAGTYKVTVKDESQYANLNDELVKVKAEAGNIVLQ